MNIYTLLFNIYKKFICKLKYTYLYIKNKNLLQFVADLKYLFSYFIK